MSTYSTSFFLVFLNLFILYLLANSSSIFSLPSFSLLLLKKQQEAAKTGSACQKGKCTGNNEGSILNSQDNHKSAMMVFQQSTAESKNRHVLDVEFIMTSGTPSSSVQLSDQPSVQPSAEPSIQPSMQPTTQPSTQPSSAQPSMQPTNQPSGQPSTQPTNLPSSQPSTQPTNQPSAQPSRQPSSRPSVQPSAQPSCSCLGTIRQSDGTVHKIGR